MTRASDRAAIRQVNDALMAIGRVLIPIDYTERGRFDHDPAVAPREPHRLGAMRALATATGDEVRPLAVRAVRDLNAVRHALRQAADQAEAVAKVKGR